MALINKNKSIECWRRLLRGLLHNYGNCVMWLGIASVWKKLYTERCCCKKSLLERVTNGHKRKYEHKYISYRAHWKEEIIMDTSTWNIGKEDWPKTQIGGTKLKYFGHQSNGRQKKYKRQSKIAQAKVAF